MSEDETECNPVFDPKNKTKYCVVSIKVRKGTSEPQDEVATSLCEWTESPRYVLVF